MRVPECTLMTHEGGLENRVLDLLGSGQPLTISAEGKSYVLPPAKVPRWRARFQKIC